MHNFRKNNERFVLTPNSTNKRNLMSGFTLIEMVIYIGLFLIVIGGGMVATYQIIEGTNADDNHIILQEEANFLLRKIIWALTGATSAVPSLDGKTLTINKDGSTLVFSFISPNLKLNSNLLNSSSISVSATTPTSIPIFQKTSTGNGIETNFILTTAQNGRNSSQAFSLVKYLRQ